MLRSYEGVSDLLVTVGRPLQVESSGRLVEVPFDPPVGDLTPYQTEMLALGLISGDSRHVETLMTTGSCDLTYEIEGECRFRVNIFQQQKRYSIVLRKLETHIRTIDELGLPALFKEMAKEMNGLVLVTGSTRSGKSTTLAALLNEMNEKRAIHILTLEDPIEFIHPVKKATFNQRELGIDFDAFATGLRAAIRQAPKVILVGEMRDRESVELGLAAASTGHLVVSTLLSNDCGQTINRIVSMFDKDEEDQIRARLSECLRYIVNQRLLPTTDGDRVAAIEMMGVNLRVRDLILNGETQDKSFYDIIGLNRSYGWCNYDQYMADLFKQRAITEETALANASRRAVLARIIDRLKQEDGAEAVDDGLALDPAADECQRLLDQHWPVLKTRFPIIIHAGGGIRIEINQPIRGLKRTRVGSRVTVQHDTSSQAPSLSVQSSESCVLPIVLHEKKRGLFRGADGPEGAEGAEGAMELQGDVSTPRPGVTHIKEPQVKWLVVAGNDKANQFRTIIELKLSPFIELLTMEGRQYTEEKADALRRVGELGSHLEIPRLESILERTKDREEKDAVEKAIEAIKGK